ncbi:MAG: N-acetylmuramic acid 6-phosphate etherase [Bacteroidales bacterium]|nr:N-acetylmuramic acid 6-phosphate etherase [Bacteroidales bacterium]
MIRKYTEQRSEYDHLERMTVRELLENMNKEDMKVPAAVTPCIPQIEKLVKGLVERMQEGGRLFYLGAGTSGRLGILDASEIPPTFGAPYDLVIGLIAGGDKAIRRAVEQAEDSEEAGWEDLKKQHIGTNDVVVGIAASGITPYVIGALRKARETGLLTACITCNPGSPVTREAEIAIVPVVGPEFVTGSTRMKSGTAQKLVLNMISTAAMIRMGHVVGNKMVDMQLTNAKLIERGTRMIMEDTGIEDYDKARSLLLQYGTVRAAVEFVNKDRYV